MLLSQARSAAASGNSRPSAAEIRAEVLADLAQMVEGDLAATSKAALAMLESESFLPASTLSTTRGWLRAASLCEAKRGVAALRLADLPVGTHVCFYSVEATEDGVTRRLAEVKVSELPFTTKWAKMSDIFALAADAVGIQDEAAVGLALWRETPRATRGA